MHVLSLHLNWSSGQTNWLVVGVVVIEVETEAVVVEVVVDTVDFEPS